MRIVICPDSFKGSLTAAEASLAITEGILRHCPDAEVFRLPVGDGGEGTSMAIASSLGQDEEITCDTFDSLRRPITASYRLVTIGSVRTALIESAAASGLTLLHPDERDIMKADTYGTGVLITDAWRRGIKDFVICMGGTATCDGGYGAFQAIMEIAGEDFSSASISLLCDVVNPLCGPQGAAAVFGPQKGATPAMIPILDGRLIRQAKDYSKFKGIDTTHMEYAGAAGGLAAMFMACFGGRPARGIEKVLDLLEFDRHIEGADLVITGEGKADATTLQGKAPMGILERARRKGIPVVLLAGHLSDENHLKEAGFRMTVQATPEGMGCPVGQEARDFLALASRKALKDFLSTAEG